ncbi:MAG: tetratricopeptide repeat protein, partial [Candidatus Omnitrophica bacterium]|nr:tetratricopeptide repeat protein [Candidatus Omnitrophota bacterium]
NKAFQMWNSALKKAPGKKSITDHLVRGYSIFGKRLKEQRIYNQALVQFKNALKHEPGNIDIRSQLADTFFQMRNFMSALQEYQKILDVDPRNKTARQGVRECKRLGGLR